MPIVSPYHLWRVVYRQRSSSSSLLSSMMVPIVNQRFRMQVAKSTPTRMRREVRSLNLMLEVLLLQRMSLGACSILRFSR